MNKSLLIICFLFNFLSVPDFHLTATSDSLTLDYASEMKQTGLPIINSMLGGTGLRPRAFRTSEIVPFGRLKQINPIGLDALHMSGSSQPSPNEMDEVKKFWKKRKVHWIALRKEEVWAIEPKGGGAIVVSQMHPLTWWSGEDVSGQKTADQIHLDELALLSTKTPGQTLTVFGNRDLEPSLEAGEAYDLLYRLDIKAEKVFTLQQMVENRGMIYHRVIDNKFGPIAWHSIDALVNILRDIPEEDAVHFHCKKGQSRTTIGMVIYDIMRNVGKLSVKEIIKRNGPEGLGGASLDSEEVEKGKSPVPYKDSWESTLAKFYEYCAENKSQHYALSFSAWCELKGITPEPEIALKDYAHTLTINSFLPKVEDEILDPAPNVNQLNFQGPLVLTVLDEKKVLPNNLRSTQDFYLNPHFNTKGLNKSYVVASSQPTAQAAKLLFKQINKDFKGRPLIVVDLRHDEHWLVYSGEMGHDVNDFEPFSALGKRISGNEIVENEQRGAALLAAQAGLRLHVIKEKYPKEEYGDKYTVTLAPTQVLTEKEMVEALKATYVRIPAARFGEILDENVEQQVELRKSHPEAVIYYHCKNGKSRTTLALCIEDMMMNAEDVSMPDIVRRQYGMGGSNLFDITAKDASWPQERDFKRQWLVFLARFHAYAKEQKSQGFVIPWGEWSMAHPGLPASMPQTELDKLIIDNTP